MVNILVFINRLQSGGTYWRHGDPSVKPLGTSPSYHFTPPQAKSPQAKPPAKPTPSTKQPVPGSWF